MSQSVLTQTFVQGQPIRYPVVGAIHFDEKGEYVFIGTRQQLEAVTNILAQHNTFPVGEVQGIEATLPQVDLFADAEDEFRNPEFEAEDSFQDPNEILDNPVSTEEDEEDEAEPLDPETEPADVEPDPFASVETSTAEADQRSGAKQTKGRGSRGGTASGGGQEVKLDADGFPV